MKNDDTVGTVGRRQRFLFGALVAVIVGIAWGHLYLVEGLTTIRLGLPVWLWLQIGVIAASLGLAWVAIGLVPRRERAEEAQ
ncbi:MAG: hypothetical protein ACOCPZ_00630 [Natrialbaceae archaeon]